MASDAQLQIILKLKDEATAQMRQVANETKGMESSFASLGNALKGLGITIGVTGAAIGAFSLAKAAAEAQVVEGAFTRMASGAGMASAELVAAMQRATAGTIEGTDLMQMANAAMTKGVLKNQADIVTVMELSRLKGQQLGMSTQEAYAAIVSAMTSGSERYLKQLGILADTTLAQKTYADSIGKTVSQLTDVELQQIAVNSVLAVGRTQLQETGGAADTAADQFAILQVKIAELKETIGTGLLPVLVPGVGALSSFFSALDRGIRDLTAITSWKEFDLWLRGFPASTRTSLAEAAAAIKAFQEVERGWMAPTFLAETRAVKDSYNAWEQWGQLMDTMATGPMLAFAKSIITPREEMERFLQQTADDVTGLVGGQMDTWLQAWRAIIGETELMPIQLALVIQAENDAVAMMKEFAKATRTTKEEVEATATAMMTLAQFQRQLGAPTVIAAGAGPGGIGQILDLIAQGYSAADAAAKVNAAIRGAATAAIAAPGAQIPGYQHGGVVSGPIGQPQLAVVHGGERVSQAASVFNIKLILDGRVLSAWQGHRAELEEQVRSS